MSKSSTITTTLSDKELAANFRPRIAAYIKRIARAEDIEDITHESLEKILLKRQTYRGESDFSYWVFKVVANTLTDYYRRKREITPGDDIFSQTQDVKTPGPESLLLRNEQSACIREKAQLLSEKDSHLLYLFYFEKLTINEIANKLNVKADSIKVRLHRARNKLKAVLMSECAISVNCNGELSCEEV